MIPRMLMLVVLAGGLLWSAPPDLVDGGSQIAQPSYRVPSQVRANRPALRTSAPVLNAIPFWNILENLGPTDRANARISLELPLQASEEAQNLAQAVESLWNAGHFEAALQRARDLARYLDPTRIAVGIQWREPRRTSYRWGNDVVITQKDSVYSVRLVRHEGTGHLFTLVTYKDTATNRYFWSLHMSTDGGDSWVETFAWSYTNQKLPTGLATMGEDVYIAYGGNESDPTTARLRRADAATGTIDAAYNWHEVFNFGVAINEIELWDNSTYNNNRLYYAAILDDQELVFFWIGEDGLSYHQIPTGVTSASRGLSGTWNDGVTPGMDQYSFLSYINANDSVHVLRLKTDDTFEDLGNIDYAGSIFMLYTDIAAHQDTVIVAFEHEGAVADWVKYRINYGQVPSGPWNWGSLAPDTTAYSYCPVLTGTHNDGFGAAFFYDGPIAYRHRSYNIPAWSDPEILSDEDASIVLKPDIAWISSGVYGVAYVDDPHSRVLFDRSDWTDVAEGPGDVPAGALTLRALPTHHGARLLLQVPQAGPARLEVFNVAGARIQEIPLNLTAGTHEVPVSVPRAGVYLARLVTPDAQATVRFVVVR